MGCGLLRRIFRCLAAAAAASSVLWWLVLQREAEDMGRVTKSDKLGHEGTGRDRSDLPLPMVRDLFDTDSTECKYICI